MNQATVTPLASWQNYYVIVGSAAGALTGLQFVVLTLVAQIKQASSMREIRAFGSPTVVHFCTALLISALMAAPWQSPANFGILLGLGGVAGVSYSLGTVWHAWKAAYNPDVLDWIFYAALPLAAHLALVAASVLLWRNSGWALSIIAADSLTFVLLGVHNSWDTVTYLALQNSGQTAKE